MRQFAAGAAASLLAAAALASLLAGCVPASGGPPDLAAARSRLASGDARGAIDMLRGRVGENPETAELLAEAYAAVPFSEAEGAATLAPLASSNDPRLVLVAARAAVRADQVSEAEVMLRQLVERNPRAEEAAIEQAKLLGRMDRVDESLAVLERYERDEPRILNLIGYAHFLAERYEEARGYFERSVEVAGRVGRDYAPARYHLGLYYRQKGELQAALEQFRRACAANPSHLEAHYQWMSTAEALGLAEEARIAQGAFGRIYRGQLAAAGALEDPQIPIDAPVDRSVTVEFRTAVEGAGFRRRIAAGASVEVACRTPSAGKARYRVSVVDGPSSGSHLLDVVHETHPAGPPAWIPHRLTLPAAAAGAQVELLFEVLPTGIAGRLGLGNPPDGAAFSEPTRLGDPAARSSNPRPNLLLISLDTLRADRLGCYGAGRDTSPVLDALASEGIRFSRAEAPSNWTLPSHYSLLSGLTPAAHGVLPDLDSVHGFIFPDRQLKVRGSGREVMLAERLHEAGYRTVAITENGWVGAHFGFDQGFDVYRSDIFGNLPRTLGATLAELDANGEGGPWFLFVHTYAPHQPYHAPRDFRTKWADPEGAGFSWPEARVPIEDYFRFHTSQFPAAASDVLRFRGLYDGQILWMDSLLAQLLSWIDRRGLAEQTVVVVTSDHGEEIFERGRFLHGDTLYEEVTRVPLIIRAPGRVAARRVVDQTVSLIDVPATLLDLAGLADRHGEGYSLRGYWEGEAAPRPVLAYAFGRHSERLTAAWDGDWKYVRRDTASGTVEELFDLSRDPAERTNLAAANRRELQELQEILARHAASAETIRQDLGAVDTTLDRETLERLRSLGYAK